MANSKGASTAAWLDKLKEIEVDDINNIDWENMGSWPLPGRIVFAALVAIALLIGSYFYLISDEIDRLKAEQQRELTLKRDFESKAFRVANLEQYKDQLVEMEQSFGSLLKQLPRDTEVPGLIDDISGSALGAGLALEAIDPSTMVRTEFYNELPINIEVMGEFHEMGSFVSTVASLPRIVTLHDFNIESQENSELRMTIQAKTYQYNPEEE
ncbi:pilus assembly protein PilP [Bacterioplanes sanyensis]|uniref:type 4a pilus biogenesis protein PilO n=1 Tax=Bacterioplanes sanyensis TaxID=1249553 RepID=UPI00167728E3|nr:type 4a pilus biogenesis protein PilO [Bacterioplanes sanyensis]GGY36091.1 pilus assembly protein PilP [Bacterioplanes sanyensis]